MPTRALHLVLAVLASIAVAAVAANPAQAASSGGMRITSIYFDPPGPDTGSNASLVREWVHLHNITSSRVYLKNWTLRDPAGHVYVFPDISVAANGNIWVHTGSGTRDTWNLYWGQGWYVWNNTGDTATVRNAGGTFIDHCTYKASADPEAFC